MSKETIKIDGEEGQTMAEYAVVLGVITFAIVATFSVLSGSIDSAFQRTISIVQALI